MLGLTTSLNIVISNYFHKSCIQLYVKVSELWCTPLTVNIQKNRSEGELLVSRSLSQSVGLSARPDCWMCGS